MPCGNVGMQVHVRANRTDRVRVGSVRRSGLEQAGLVVSGSVMVGSGSDQLCVSWAVRSHVGPDWAEPVVKCAGSESGSKRRSA